MLVQLQKHAIYQIWKTLRSTCSRTRLSKSKLPWKLWYKYSRSICPVSIVCCSFPLIIFTIHLFKIIQIKAILNFFLPLPSIILTKVYSQLPLFVALFLWPLTRSYKVDTCSRFNPYNLSFLQKFLFQLPLFVALSFDHSFATGCTIKEKLIGYCYEWGNNFFA